MIVVDTSALIAIVLDEPSATWLERVLQAESDEILNFGDCFAYALAVEKNCPLLFIGNDFSRTDVKSVLANQSGA
jgi:ribonuclease VapC